MSPEYRVKELVMGATFEIEGWKEFTERCEKVVNRWESKKLVLMQKLANICLAEISRFIPVDTSRLVSSFQVGVVTPNEAEVGTNVEYALYVNDGHAQHERFLPIQYISVNGKGLTKGKIIEKYGEKYKGKKGGIRGILLKERYVAGKYFLEKGMKQAEPRLKTLRESFMEQNKI